MVSADARSDLHDALLVRYNKAQHPPNAVRLIYAIVFVECPIPGDSGVLLSKVHETQVRSSEAN